METSALNVKTFLILLLVSVMPYIQAQTETEYEGILIYEGQADDRRWGPLPIGFDFVFFGNTYNEFFINSNGQVLFGAGSNLFANASIPDDRRPDNFIAPFWDDLIIHSSGDIMYQLIGTAPNRKLVVQFSNMSFWTSTILLGSFQVILFEGSNQIQMQYKNIVDLSSDRSSGGEATIGLENLDGTAGVLCSYNTPGYIYSGRAILFTPGEGTYTFDDNAIYDNILLVNAIPKAGIPGLVSPTHNSSVQETVTFMWEAAAHSSGYFVQISQNTDMSSPLHTSPDLTGLSYEYTLGSDQTYYWTANAKNASGDVTQSEIWSFKTSSTPVLLAVPQTIQLEQGDIKMLPLYYTGGDSGPKTATITSLPGEGALYQNNSGTPGAQISSVPADVSDPFFNVFYSASGAAGNGAGSFGFLFRDGSGSSPEVTFTIHVSPPAIPNFLYAAKASDRVEITFDRKMADPTGFHTEFAVEDNGVGLTSTSCELKDGDPYTIVVYVSPAINTTNTITVAYTRGSITAASGGALESFDFQLAEKIAQSISFDALADRTYGDPAYTLVATASSGLPVGFSSSNATVVSVSGTTASIINAGETYITAVQSGDATYAAARFEQHQLINKAAATIMLSDLVQDYTGTGVSATAGTEPPGLNVIITYDGSTDLPVDLGSYAVLAQIVDPYYAGSASGILTINDLSAPVPDQESLPALLDECSVTPVAPTATDLNAGQITGTTGTPFPITGQGTTIVTWTFDDGYGNTSSQTQSVVINDMTAPLMPALTDQTLDCSVPAQAPTTTDNCAGTITGTTGDPVSFPGLGTYVITWTFDDGNGNSVSASQNISVVDMTAPTATAPADVVTCDGKVNGIGLSDVADNCTDMPVVSYELSGASSGSGSGNDASAELFNPGVTTVTYTVDDGNGNSSQYQVMVTYQVVDPIVVTLTDGTLNCETEGTFQWISCADNSVITGETSSSYSPATSGDYAVILTQGGCSDTSECITVDLTGVDDRSFQDYRLYPNPVHDRLSIEMGTEQYSVSIRVYDMTGNLLKVEEVERLTKTELDLSEFKPGLYMIHIRSEQLNSVSRVIKE